MSTTIRIVLIIVSVLTMLYTIRKIRKSQMEIADAIFWLALSAGLVILSVFPQVAILCAQWLGFISAANFIYVAVIFVIILKLFTLSIEVSQLKSMLRKTIQEHAITENEREDKK